MFSWKITGGFSMAMLVSRSVRLPFGRNFVTFQKRNGIKLRCKFRKFCQSIPMMDPWDWYIFLPTFIYHKINQMCVNVQGGPLLVPVINAWGYKTYKPIRSYK